MRYAVQVATETEKTTCYPEKIRQDENNNSTPKNRNKKSKKSHIQKGRERKKDQVRHGSKIPGRKQNIKKGNKSSCLPAVSKLSIPRNIECVFALHRLTSSCFSCRCFPCDESYQTYRIRTDYDSIKYIEIVPITMLLFSFVSSVSYQSRFRYRYPTLLLISHHSGRQYKGRWTRSRYRHPTLLLISHHSGRQCKDRWTRFRYRYPTLLFISHHSGRQYKDRWVFIFILYSYISAQSGAVYIYTADTT